LVAIQGEIELGMVEAKNKVKNAERKAEEAEMKYSELKVRNFIVWIH